MKKSIMKNIFVVAVAALAVLLLSGCMRKHIVSSPPAQKPGTKAAATPAPTPKVSEAKPAPEVIEETYVVDGPADSGEPTVIREGELAEEEPALAVQTEVIVEETAVEKETVDEAATKAEQEPAEPVLGDMYYVQVGAFSDLDNANKALANLISQGYKGSRLSKTDDGLYRVQAGAFTDKVSADDALSKLLAEYPKGFVFKERVTE